MKKRIITVMALAMCFSFVKAQTTMEEYNYVTKGYKVQIESGLDMKKGYEFQDLSQSTSGERKVFVKKLIQTSTTNRIAAYLLLYQFGDNKQYICIPNPSSPQDVKDAFFASLNQGRDIPNEKLSLFVWSLSKILVW
jgi:hypothetical protein